MRHALPLSSLIGPCAALLVLSVATGCGSKGGFVDTGVPGLVDGGFNRADAGVDTGVQPPVDAGFDDAGNPIDSGPLPDTGPAPDAGPQPDAEPGPDTGVDTPTFTEQSIDSTIVHGQGVEAVDIDGDNDLDLLSSLSLTDAVYLYVNDGAGNFTQVTVGTGIVAMETAVADFDGDNDLDIAAVGLFQRSGGFSSPGEVVWYENPGNVSGTWTKRSITGFTFWGGLYIEAGDLTGDDRADLVVGAIQLSDGGGNPQGNGVHWFRNTGGAFASPVAIDAQLLEVSTVAVHDVDADGVLDVMALGSNSSEIAWWQNGRDQGQTVDNPAFSKHVIATPSGPYAMDLANMDDDPSLELLVTTADAGGSVVYYKAGANVTEPWAQTVVAQGIGGPLASRVFAADLNGDQSTDVAVGVSEATSIAFFLQTAPGQFSPAPLVRNDYTGLNWLTGGDVDRDGRVDLITATYERAAGADQLSWWKNQ